jgi:hypothetical protein
VKLAKEFILGTHQVWPDYGGDAWEPHVGKSPDCALSVRVRLRTLHSASGRTATPNALHSPNDRRSRRTTSCLVMV